MARFHPRIGQARATRDVDLVVRKSHHKKSGPGTRPEVSKFRALVSRNRPEEKQHLDASDFIQMVKRHRDRLDRDRLQQLGEAVYSNGGDHLLILEMVDDVLA